jgi:Methyltransferase domain
MAAQLSIVETTAGNPLVGPVSAALTQAIAGRGRLAPEILRLDGMSGRKYRIFINNLVGMVDDPRYLEIGVWQGSTLCAALYRNRVRALAIDDWSQFGGSRAGLLANLRRFRGEAAVSLLDRDFRAVDFAAIGKFNLYLFDGPHGGQDQYDGVTLAQPALDRQFVLIVDDWNWRQVRAGTLQAVSDLDLRLDFAAEIRTTLDDTHPPPAAAGPQSDWHNGCFIAVCTQPPER